MARTPRVFVPNGIYHVASRGSDRRPLFLFDRDREAFLGRLARIVESYELPCLAYCLMGNHYHLIIQTPDERLSMALKELHGGYSTHFNRTYGRSAHLFRNRFLAQVIDSDPYLLTACRYVAHNPVRAGLCARPSDWRWSSYRANAGIDPSPRFLSEAALRDASGGSGEWRSRYREFVESPSAVEPPPGHKKLHFRHTDDLTPPGVRHRGVSRGVRDESVNSASARVTRR
jgi:putative transposase